MPSVFWIFFRLRLFFYKTRFCPSVRPFADLYRSSEHLLRSHTCFGSNQQNVKAFKSKTYFDSNIIKTVKTNILGIPTTRREKKPSSNQLASLLPSFPSSLPLTTFPFFPPPLSAFLQPPFPLWLLSEGQLSGKLFISLTFRRGGGRPDILLREQYTRSQQTSTPSSKLAHHQTNQPPNQPTCQSTKQSTNQSGNQTGSRPANKQPTKFIRHNTINSFINSSIQTAEHPTITPPFIHLLTLKLKQVLGFRHITSQLSNVNNSSDVSMSHRSP